VNPIIRSAYLTAAQVAERLGASAKTASRWAKNGRLAPQRTLGGYGRYHPGQIGRLARELAVPAAQP
jgi:predicted site-specific integrase-resolvase